MKILYENKSARSQFCSEYSKKWKYPSNVQMKIKAMENYIQSAESLKDIYTYKPYRMHSLIGDRKNEWSLSLGNTGYRVTFIPCDDNEKEITQGDIISQCKSIKIIKVTEVSNLYE